MREQRLELYELPDYKSRKNRSQTITASTRTSRRTATYTGMGADINVHDQWAVESMGKPYKIAPTSIWVRPTRRSCNIVKLLRQEIEKAVKGGGKPF